MSVDRTHYRAWRIQRTLVATRAGMSAAFVAGWLLVVAGWLFDTTILRFLPSVLVSSPGFLVVVAASFRRPTSPRLPTLVAIATAVWGASIVWGAHRWLHAPELGTTAVMLVLLFAVLLFRLEPWPLLPISVGLAAEHTYLLLHVPDGTGVAGGVIFHVALTGSLAASVQVLSVVDDWTQRRQYRQERLLADRTRRVEELLQERTEFFTGVSHELRSPMAAVRGYGEMLSDPRFEVGPDWRARAGGALQQVTKQVLALVDDVLDIAQSSEGRLPLDLQPIDLTELVHHLRPTIESLAGGSRLTASVDGDAPAFVSADADRLRTTVLNLVGNAIKYTPAGGAIRVSVTTAGDRVRLAVSDDGIGVPANARDRIFEPFFRAPGIAPHHGFPASGLGLALVQRVVEAHGGIVRLEPCDGPGSTFVVELPRCEDATTARMPRQEGPAGEDTQTWGRRSRGRMPG